MSKYKYLIFDGSYFLMRQFHLHRSNYFRDIPVILKDGSTMFDENGEIVLRYEYTFSTATLVKTFYWSISKFIREKISCEKPVIVFDKGPYHKLRDLEEYKGDRHYYSEDDLEGITYENNPKEWLETNEEIRIEKMKLEARQFIMDEFSKLGIPVIYHVGYEGDDLAYLISRYLKDDKDKSGIVSIDNDWSYLINENIDHIKPNGTVITYEQMKNKFINDVPEELNLSLYQYKSFMDSLFGSHNNLQKTVNDKIYNDPNHIECIRSANKLEDTYLSDIKLFSLQLNSFNVDEYPELDLVKCKISHINKTQKPISIQDYRLFCTLTGFQVSESYYNKTINTFNQELYE